MKRILFMMLVAAMIAPMSVNAQKSEKQIVKEAKSRAKKEEKAGWKVTPGALSLQQQYEELFRMQSERVDGNKKYIFVTSESVGQFYNTAKMAAVEQGKLLLAGEISSEITGLVDNELASQGITPEEAQDINATVAGSTNLISASLGRVITVVECHQILENKNTKVSITIAYDSKQATEKAKKAVLQELTKKSKALRGKLEKLLGQGE